MPRTSAGRSRTMIRLAVAGAAVAPSIGAQEAAPADPIGGPAIVEQDAGIAFQPRDYRLPALRVEPAPVRAVRDEPVLPADADLLAERAWRASVLGEGEPAVGRLPDGSILTLRRGRVERVPDTPMLLFVPDADARVPGEGPMPLLPCQTLARLEAALTNRDEDLAVTLSGSVFLYRGRNYLLPSLFSLRTREPEPATPAAAAPRPSAASPADDEVAALIRELREERGEAIGPGRTAGESLAAMSEEELLGVDQQRVRLLAEGSMITRRLARLARVPEGGWALQFDQGPDGVASMDAPIPVLEGAVLTRMEAAADAQGDAARLLVSGRITTYRGRNFIIPTLFQVVRNDELEPLHAGVDGR